MKFFSTNATTLEMQTAEVGKAGQRRDEGGVSLSMGAIGSRTCRCGPHVSLRDTGVFPDLDEASGQGRMFLGGILMECPILPGCWVCGFFENAGLGQVWSKAGRDHHTHRGITLSVLPQLLTMIDLQDVL